MSVCNITAVTFRLAGAIVPLTGPIFRGVYGKYRPNPPTPGSFRQFIGKLAAKIGFGQKPASAFKSQPHPLLNVAKIEIPESLKADLPQTALGRIMSATPIVMTVIATMLAGLASSEMTKAQYDRSLAAQQQSKAGDQWSFFQAKRLRSAFQSSALDQSELQASNEIHPLDTVALLQSIASSPGAEKTLPLLDSEAGLEALALLQKGKLPAIASNAAVAPEVKAALNAIEALKPDAEIAELLAKVSDKLLTESILSAKERTDAFDAATKPVNQAIDTAENALQQKPTSPTKRDFIAARLRFAALRYDTEARLNQAIASLYELQVRKNNISAERHHHRSQRFFYGMLGAQMAVIISTFSIAARQRNLLWTLAAAAGVTALAFAAYVYLYV